MNIERQNTQRDALKGLTPEERAYLLDSGRVALTEVRATRYEASAWWGSDVAREAWEGECDWMPLMFGGSIITHYPLEKPGESGRNAAGWREAEDWAIVRGWGERVVGRLVATIAADGPA